MTPISCRVTLIFDWQLHFISSSLQASPINHSLSYERISHENVTGVLLASIARGVNVDLFSYLFGSILSISSTEVILSVVHSVLLIALISIYFNDLFSLTFDEESALASGINTKLVNTLFVLMAAVTVVLSMKIVGIMLISALIAYSARYSPAVVKKLPCNFCDLIFVGSCFCCIRHHHIILSWSPNRSLYCDYQFHTSSNGHFL